MEVTMPQSLYQNWQFAIEVNGFDVALFKKGQEPKTEFEEVAFAPAGSMFDQKVAGRMKFEDITLEKGVLADGSDESARDWVRIQADVNAGVGALPASGSKVRFVYLDGHKEKRLAHMEEPSISAAMMIRILDIDGNAPSKKALNGMSMRDRSALRQEMLRVDAGIDTSIESDCDSCGTRIRTRLEAEPSFLFPGVRL